jgi:hypothetical protein
MSANKSINSGLYKGFGSRNENSLQHNTQHSTFPSLRYRSSKQYNSHKPFEVGIKNGCFVFFNREKVRKGELLVDAAHKGLLQLGITTKKAPVNGLGADLVNSIFLFECKNWSGEYYVTSSMVKSEILPRFRSHRQQRQWILVISKLHASKKVRELLKANNITIIELGFQIKTQRQLQNAINKLTTLFIKTLSHFRNCLFTRLINSKFHLVNILLLLLLALVSRGCWARLVGRLASYGYRQSFTRWLSKLKTRVPTNTTREDSDCSGLNMRPRFKL